MWIHNISKILLLLSRHCSIYTSHRSIIRHCFIKFPLRSELLLQEFRIRYAPQRRTWYYLLSVRVLFLIDGCISPVDGALRFVKTDRIPTRAQSTLRPETTADWADEVDAEVTDGGITGNEVEERWESMANAEVFFSFIVWGILHNVCADFVRCEGANQRK